MDAYKQRSKDFGFTYCVSGMKAGTRTFHLVSDTEPDFNKNSEWLRTRFGLDQLLGIHIYAIQHLPGAEIKSALTIKPDFVAISVTDGDIVRPSDAYRQFLAEAPAQRPVVTQPPPKAQKPSSLGAPKKSSASTSSTSSINPTRVTTASSKPAAKTSKPKVKAASAKSKPAPVAALKQEPVQTEAVTEKKEVGLKRRVIVDSDEEEEKPVSSISTKEDSMEVESQQEQEPVVQEEKNAEMNQPSLEQTANRNKRKKAVQKKRVYKDAWGKMVTESYTDYVTASESEEPAPRPAPLKKPKLSNNSSTSGGKSKQEEKSKYKQASVLSFFKKKQ